MGNIADSPKAIASHFASGARTVGHRRTAQIHLRDAGDGYWTRLRLYTIKNMDRFVTYLTFDEHKERENGESVRIRVGAETFKVIAAEDVPGRYSEKRLIAAFDRAAASLLADPTPIATVLTANDPHFRKEPTP
jgi:hypothetical protein